MKNKCFYNRFLSLVLIGWIFSGVCYSKGVDLIGKWQWKNDISGELILNSNNTYSLLSHWNGISVWESGQFSVTNNLIHFVIEDYEPKEYGIPPKKLIWPKESSLIYRFISKDHIEFKNNTFGTRWDAYRDR